MASEFIAGEDLKENDRVYILGNNKVYKVKTEREKVCNEVINVINGLYIGYQSASIYPFVAELFKKITEIRYK